MREGHAWSIGCGGHQLRFYEKDKLLQRQRMQMHYMTGAEEKRFAYMEAASNIARPGLEGQECIRIGKLCSSQGKKKKAAVCVIETENVHYHTPVRFYQE